LKAKILEFPIFFLANSLHTAYSTLYLSTVSLLAKWTIAIGISDPLGIAFLIFLEKPPFALKMMAFRRNGHLEGVTDLAESTYLSRLVSHWLCGAGKTEIFQSGAPKPRGVSCRSGFCDCLLFHSTSKVCSFCARARPSICSKWQLKA
jgi:hypothetical protein